eukprot:Awhi_evm1s13877
MDHEKLKWYIYCETLPELHSAKPVPVLKFSFRGPRRISGKKCHAYGMKKIGKDYTFRVHYENRWDELNKKSKCDLYQKIHIENAKSMKKVGFKMKGYLNKLTTSNRLKIKLASASHILRSELSRWDNR